MATIVVAETQMEFREVLRGVLTAYRHEVLIASTGEQVLQLAENRRPAVVLLDLALPGMSSLAVLAKLRARAPHLPVVVLADNVSTDVESRARELGACNVLRKGLKLDVIMQTVARAFEHASQSARTASVTAHSEREDLAAAPVAAATILIVDDEVEIGELVGEFLGQRGYRVLTAMNGHEALAKMASASPDIVLLDVYMPEMNGVEVLRQLKNPASPVHAPVGVILLTASQDEPLLKEALNLGAFDVLPKPVDLQQIELAIMVKLVMGATT